MALCGFFSYRPRRAKTNAPELGSRCRPASKHQRAAQPHAVQLDESGRKVGKVPCHSELKFDGWMDGSSSIQLKTSRSKFEHIAAKLRRKAAARICIRLHKSASLASQIGRASGSATGSRHWRSHPGRGVVLRRRPRKHESRRPRGVPCTIRTTQARSAARAHRAVRAGELLDARADCSPRLLEALR